MFYTYNILCKQRGGKFSCVYRAATIGVKKSINDKELEKLKVVELGQEIYDMITTKSMNVKDRLALRLSAILVNGLVRIHSAQVDQLLEECGGSKSLAFGDLEDIVPVITSSSDFNTPELLISVKQRKPRRPRKKPASKPLTDLNEFRIPEAISLEKDRQNDLDIIPEIAPIIPQRDPDIYLLTSDDSPPEVNQMNIVVEADIHMHAEPYIVSQEIIQQEELMQIDAQITSTLVPTIIIDPSTKIDVLQDQTVLPHLDLPDRSLRQKAPKEPEALFIDHRNRARRINQDLQEEATLKKRKRNMVDKSGLDIGELQCYFQNKEEARGEFTIDEMRDAESYITLDSHSIDAIRTSQQASLSHFEISKSIKDSLIDEDKRKKTSTFGIDMDGIELLHAIIEDQSEDQIEEFSKLSNRAQRLINKLKKFPPSRKMFIEDLCRKPVQKKDIVIVFQALLEIHANTNVLDLIIKGAEDFNLDYIFIK